MTSLSDAFPDEERKRFAESSLVAGAVLKVFAYDTKPPKEKRVVVIAIARSADRVACVYINSKLNERVFPTEYLKTLNPKLDKANRDYLSHDSFVDCSQLTSTLIQSL